MYEENSAGGAGGATPTNFRRYTPPACVMNSRQQKDPFSRKTGALGNPFAKQPPKNNPFAKKKMTFAPKKTFGANTSYSEPMNNGYSEPKRNNPFAKQKKAFTVTRHDIATCLRYGQNGSQPRKSSMVKIGTTMNQDVERYGEVLPPKVTRGMLAVQRDIATVLSYKKGSKQSRGFGKVREDLSDVRETIDEEEYRQPWNNNGGRKRNSTSVYYE